MAPIWNRIPMWGDWIAAIIAAVVVLNVNVTSAGDPLSGLADGVRSTLYATLVVGGLVLAAAGLIMSARSSGGTPIGGLLVRTYSCVAGAGLLGLLLDYRDGPVRTVQLVVYVMVTIGALRLARVSAQLSAPGHNVVATVATDGHRSSSDI